MCTQNWDGMKLYFAHCIVKYDSEVKVGIHVLINLQELCR